MSVRELLSTVGRELALALSLVVGGALVVIGIAHWSAPIAYIAAGLIVAGIGFLFTAEAAS